MNKTNQPDDYYPGKDYQRLFNAINDASPNPLLSQMQDIIRVVHEDFPTPPATVIHDENFNTWLSVKNHTLPLETHILVAHQFGVEAICLFSENWIYWYTGKMVGMEVLSTMTHFLIPKKP